MVFTKRLREGVRRGFITSSIRIWQRPHVKVGGRYRMDEGEIVIDSVELISMHDITVRLMELPRGSVFISTVGDSNSARCRYLVPESGVVT